MKPPEPTHTERLLPPGWMVTALLVGFLLGCQHQERIADIYAGLTSEGATDATLRSGIGSASAEPRLRGDFMIGGRGGGFFMTGALEPGLAADISGDFFSLENMDVEQFLLSGLFLFRACLLRSEDWPHGRVQPYAGLGPLYSFSSLDAHFVRANGLIEDGSHDFGFDARVGLSIPITRRFALFTEYRGTYTRADFDGELQGIPFEIEIETFNNHVLFGASLRF